MKKTIVSMMAIIFLFSMSHSVIAAESSVGKPNKQDIHKAMQAYIDTEAVTNGGYLVIDDPDTETTRRLSLVSIHDRVGKTGDYYYSCADFKDADSGEMLDLDMDVEDSKGSLRVVDVRIHKVNGDPRYTYDADDNRIPLDTPEIENMDTTSDEEQHQEHGGKEHGGHEHGGSDHK